MSGSSEVSRNGGKNGEYKSTRDVRREFTNFRNFILSCSRFGGSDGLHDWTLEAGGVADVRMEGPGYPPLPGPLDETQSGREIHILAGHQVPGKTLVTGREGLQAAAQRRHSSARIGGKQCGERARRAQLGSAHLKVDGEGAQLDGRSGLRLEIRLALGCGGRHGEPLKIEAEGCAGNSVHSPSDGCSEMTAAVLIL